jgi:tripeptidyl-peptidase-1
VSNKVGGTKLADKNISDGEVAESFSGGGFSNVFTLPSYQSAAVTNYLTKFPPPYTSEIFNNSGRSRAYPDVSAIGSALAIVFLGKAGGVGGTSASTPIVASLVTLLNEERIKAGKGPIGFLNPTFYAHPEAFNDITVGQNPGCGTNGFNATRGWDPVTGLGTPNYPKLREVFMRLP